MTKEQSDLIDDQFRSYLTNLGAQTICIKYAFAQRSDNDFYTKPNSGMILKYLYQNEISNINNVGFIGDSEADRVTANNLNLNFWNINQVESQELLEKIKQLYQI